MSQTLTDDFLGLHKNMNCGFPLTLIHLLFKSKNIHVLVHLNDVNYGFGPIIGPAFYHFASGVKSRRGPKTENALFRKNIITDSI